MGKEMSRDEVLALGNIDPILQAEIDKMGGSCRPPSGDIPELRKVMNSLAPARTPPPDGVLEEDFTFSARDGYTLEARLHYPSQKAPTGHALVIVIHGGGYALGGMWQDEPFCRTIVQKFGVVCVQCSYRLAPEHPFPTPVLDCWDFVKWTANAAKAPGGKLFEIGVRPSEKGFVIAGTSSGANAVDVCLHLARDESLDPHFTGAIELIPEVIAPGTVPDKYKDQYMSWSQTADAPVFQPSTLDWLHSNYKPDISSPLYNSFSNPRGHVGLPPIYFQVCGMDPVRDDALIYERVLRTELGIKTKVDIYSGWPHGFWAMFPGTPADKIAQQELDHLNGLAWLLDLAQWK